MKRVIKVEDRCQELARWHGASAKLWLFRSTHSRLALLLYRVNRSEVLYVVGNACEYISGPFAWDDAHIEVSAIAGRQAGESLWKVTDRTSGFELHCGDVLLAGADCAELDLDFEGFLGDEAAESSP